MAGPQRRAAVQWTDMRLLRRHAAIDHQFRAGDPGWIGGRQEQQPLADILGGTGRPIDVRSAAPGGRPDR